MNKHHLAGQRKVLLELWLKLLRDAEARTIHQAATEEPRQSLPLVITKPSNDMMELLLGGIQRALDGDADPFGIQPPARGKVSPDTWPERVAAVAEVLTVIGEIQRDGLPDGHRDYVAEAIGIVAGRRHVKLGESALREAYKDKEIRGWAELHNNRP